ncbi:MAG: ribonucleotide reductase N-terminal alpha domain-containing protein, partial [Planctomycetota bacterium]
MRKRDGRVVPFEQALIVRAMAKAFCADRGLAEISLLDDALLQKIEMMTQEVVSSVDQSGRQGSVVGVEQVQDWVENELMRNEFFSVARRYILYRAEHAKIRQLRAEERMESAEPFPAIMVSAEGRLEGLDFDRLRRQVDTACEGLSVAAEAPLLFEEVEKQFFNGITTKEISRAMVLAARAKIEEDPSYDRVASRLILNIIYRESLDKSANENHVAERYRDMFGNYIEQGIAAERLAPELRKFDLERLADAIVPERDELFPYLGLQTIYDRYLLHIDGRRFEAPQYFWMRVAMGLALNEGEQKTSRAIEFYNLLSSFRFTSATPTLFNSGTLHPQLSSCYLSTVQDDLDSIFKQIADNAKLSKWAGGLGNDWTNIRATNSHIKGT